MSAVKRTATIVVPCYNEEQRLDLAAFRRFAAEHAWIGFLFVDDGSSDGTRAMLEEFSVADPVRFGVLALARNQGKAEAVRRGMLAAFESGSRYAGFWDADLATPLDAIPAFESVLDRRPQQQLVMGSRVLLLGRTIQRSPVRHYLGRVFATAASLTLDLPVYDTQCGAKLFRVTPLTRTAFAEPFRSRWIFDVEIIARMGRRSVAATGLPIEEIVYELPLEQWRDIAGTRLERSDFVRAVGELAGIWWAYRRKGEGNGRSIGSVPSDAELHPSPELQLASVERKS